MIGRKIGVYKILEKRGEGGMGIFYKAIDETLDRVVGFKTLHPELVADAGLRQRMEREAKSLARLNHPNIVTIYQYLADEGLHFIIMEFVEGLTLSEVIRASAPMSFKEATRIFLQVLDAIGYAHRHDVVHRDIKPANILVTDNGTVKVTDFGIAKLIGATQQTRTGQIPGSPFYMAPEQIVGRQIDPRTDIYALGITLFQMITGQVPFSADSEFLLMKKHTEDEPPMPSSVNRSLTQVHDALVNRALQKDPDDRFQSTAEFAAALSEVAAFDETSPEQSTTFPSGSILPELTTTADAQKNSSTPPSSTSPGKKKNLWWLYGLVVILGVVAIFVFLPSDDDSLPQRPTPRKKEASQTTTPSPTPTPTQPTETEVVPESLGLAAPELSIPGDFNTDDRTPVVFSASVKLGGVGDSLLSIEYHPAEGITDRRLSATTYEITFVPFVGSSSPYVVWCVAATRGGRDSVQATFMISEPGRRIQLAISPACRIMINNRIATRKPVRNWDTTVSPGINRLTLLNGRYPLRIIEMDPGGSSVQYVENLADIFSGRPQAALRINIKYSDRRTDENQALVLINGVIIRDLKQNIDLPAGDYLINLDYASRKRLTAIKFNGEQMPLNRPVYNLRSPGENIRVNKLIFTVR